LSLFAQKLDDFIQIKVEALRPCKKTCKLVVLLGTPWELHNFLSWFKVYAWV